ncbi:MAG: fibronectin type III domain-containing protein [Bacteroidales bacterium]|nr:fibronectin type III domain-containing protein [Bacteroidales bacterium]
MKKIRFTLFMLMAFLLPLALQAQQSLPYSYGFENNDLAGEGWTMSNCESATGISSSAAKTGTYGFSFRWTTNPPQYLISPELTGTESGVEVSFHYKAYSSSYTETFKVGYSTTDADIASFTWGEEVSVSSTSWSSAPYSVTLPAGTKFVGICCTSNNAYYLYIDDFSAAEPPTCIAPSGLAVVSGTVTTTSATIEWTDNNAIAPASWTIELNGTEISGITENPYTLPGLTPGNSYTVRVKADCSDEDASDYSSSITFATRCVAIADFPWSNDFESYEVGNLEAPCYVNEHISGAGTSIFRVNTYSSSGNATQLLQLPDMSNGTQTKLILPAMQIPTGTPYQFVIDIYRNATGTSYTSEGVRVFASTDGEIEGATELGFLYRNCTQTDSNVVTAEDASGWYTYEFTIPFNGTCYIILRGESQYGSSTYMDNLMVREAPSCVKPTAVNVGNITPTSAEFSWTENNSPAPQGWVILLNGQEVEADSNPFTIDTLTSNTSYTVQVKAVCNDTDESEYSAEISFTTLCDYVTIDEDNIYTEGFESYEASTFPSCWTRDVAYTSYPYVQANSTYTTYSHNGTKAMYMYFYGSANSNVISTPTFTNDVNTLQVSFFARYSSTNPTLEVGVMDGTTFEPVDTIVLTSSYQSNAFTVMFNHYTGNGNRIAFRTTPSGTSSYSSYYVYLDDVTVELIPSCIAPSNVTVIDSTITTTTATVAWTDNNNEAPDNGWTLLVNGEEVTAPTNPFTLTDLTASTIYSVKVKANCATDDESALSLDSATFATACDVVIVTETQPFSENFNTLTAGIPVCWDNEDGTTTTASYRWNYNANGYSGACVRFNSYNNSNGNTNMLKTPVLDITALATPRLTFQYKNPTAGDFSVYVSTDGGETYTTALATDLTGATAWTPMSIALEELDATDNVVIVFQGTSNYGSGDAYIYLDNVVVEETPDCFVPTYLTLDTMSTTFFQVSWTDNNEETPESWTVAYSIDGGTTFTEITGIDHDSAVVCNFDVPMGDANVIVKVKANCDADNSSNYSETISFVTPPTCPAPTELQYSGVTSNSVTLEWTAGGEETEWIIELNGVETDVVTENPITIDTLTPNTPYVVRVRALCGVGDSSVWTSGFSGFVTSCAALTAEGYTEDFGSYTANTSPSSFSVMPDCWNYIYTGTSTGYRPHVYNGTYTPTASNNSIIMTSGSSNYGAENYVVMPEFDDLSGKQIVFATAMESATRGTLSFGYLTDASDASTFNVLEVIPSNVYSGSDRYTTHEVVVHGVPAGARLAFQWLNDYLFYSCCIDDISLVDMPTCVAPMNVEADSVFATSATISWTELNLTDPQGWIININGTDTLVTENPFTFDNLTPDTSYTVQVMAVCSETDSSAWSNVVNFTTLPTCAAPTNVTVTAIGITSATINWTDPNADVPQAWVINLNGTDTTVTENPFTFDNLTSATAYTVTVKSICTDEDESALSSTVTFTTECDVIAVTENDPYHEGFESTSDWGCWTAEIVAGSYNWTHSTSYAVEGTHTAYLTFSANEARLTSPIFDLTALTTPQLTFSHRQAAFSGRVDELYVYYRTAPEESWTELVSYTTTYANMTEETIILPDASATYQICFLGHSTDALSIYLDDVNIMEAPTCFPPTDIVVNNITTTSATISWTDNNENAPQAWTINLNGTDTVVTTNPFTFDNLNAATLYTFTIKANCADDDESALSTEESFSTNCDVMTALGYSENFNSYTGTTSVSTFSVLPLCWADNFSGTSQGYRPHVYNGTYAVNSNNNALVFTGGGSTYGAVNYAIMPDFDDVNGLEITFSYKMENTGYGTLSVGYMTDITDATTFNSLGSVTSSTTASTSSVAINNVPAGARLAFKWDVTGASSYWSCSIDDITIDSVVVEPCETPTNVAVNNNVVTWTGNAANYNVVVTVAGDTVVNTTVSTNSYTVDGLNDGDHAIVTVQAICSEDNLSEWSEGVEFEYEGVGINNYSIQANVYPNPTTGNVTVESNAINADLTVFDMFGKQMMTTKVAAERTDLDFSSFAPGVYMVRIANSNAIATVKVVKK